MTEGSQDPIQRDLLAAELALGLLEGEERLEALHLQIVDSEFAGSVATWEGVIEEWVRALPEVDVPAGTWERIEAALAEERADDQQSETARAQSGWRMAAAAASVTAAFFAGVWAMARRS